MPDSLFMLDKVGCYDNFIFSYEEGTLIEKDVRYCKVCFEVNYYHDNLFIDYGVPFPIQLMGAVTHRKAEYLAGRYSANRVFTSLNISHHLHSAIDRSPMWPTGIKGSISHTKNYAIVVASDNSSISSIGIDIEQCQKGVMQEIVHQIMSPDELLLLSKSQLSLDYFGTLIFSAKEALFKALYPRVGKFFGFDSVKVIDIIYSENLIFFQLTKELSWFDCNGKILKVKFSIKNDMVETIMVS